MLPLLPLLVYSPDIQYVIRGSIAKKCYPYAALATPGDFYENTPNYFTYLFAIVETGSLQAGFWGFS